MALKYATLLLLGLVAVVSATGILKSAKSDNTEQTEIIAHGIDSFVIDGFFQSKKLDHLNDLTSSLCRLNILFEDAPPEFVLSQLKHFTNSLTAKEFRDVTHIMVTLKNKPVSYEQNAVADLFYKGKSHYLRELELIPRIFTPKDKIRTIAIISKAYKKRVMWIPSPSQAPKARPVAFGKYPEAIILTENDAYGFVPIVGRKSNKQKVSIFSSEEIDTFLNNFDEFYKRWRVVKFGSTDVRFIPSRAEMAEQATDSA
jgi:hypothetical protein